MANTLLITKETGGYFTFLLTKNGSVQLPIQSIRNDLLVYGNQCHFKTGSGANIIKEQFILPTDITIVSSGTFTFVTVDQLWSKLIEIGFFDWLSVGGYGTGANRFNDLLDTFKYIGNNGYAVVVNESEQKLKAVPFYNVKSFTELQDTPSSLVPNKMVVVNKEGTALELKDLPTIAPPSLTSVGSFHYVDEATKITPLNVVATVEKKITNDTLAIDTNVLNAPYGISSMWDSTTNQLDFSQTAIGDLVTIIPAVEIATTVVNQEFQIYIKLGIGSGNPITKQVYNGSLKSIGSIKVNPTRDFSIDTLENKDFPAEIYILSDANCTVKSGELDIKVVRKDINILSIDETKVSKAERAITYLSGNGNNINLNSESTYFVFNGVYEVMNYVYAQNFNYQGKVFSFKNEQSNDIVFNHNANSPSNNTLYFRFPSLTNFTLKPNEQIDFKARGNGTLDYVGVAGGTTDISGKVDKVAGERLINASEITKLGNQTGTNTGDQDISGKANVADLSQTLTNEVTWLTGNSQIFTLPNAYFAIYGVYLNGQKMNVNEYSFTSSTQVTVIPALANGDTIGFLYGTNASANNAPYYTQAQVDSKVAGVDISGKVDKVAGKSLILDTEITRLAGVANYTHPANHPPSIITQDASNRFVTDTEKATWNAKQNAISDNVTSAGSPNAISLLWSGTQTQYDAIVTKNASTIYNIV